MKPWVAAATGATVGLTSIVIGVWPSNPTPLEITYVYSPDFEELVAPLIADFNDDPPIVNGHPIHVNGVDYKSGEAEKRFELGNLQADAWTPAASVWGNLLIAAHEAPTKIPNTARSLVTSPQVIAMAKPCAEELEWSSSKQPSWSEVIHLAFTHGSEVGGGCSGFTLGGTYPNLSTSGLLAMASWYQLRSGSKNLNEASLDRLRDAQSSVVKIERAINEYWTASTTAMVASCGDSAPPAFTALYLQENSLVSKSNIYDCPSYANGRVMVAVYPTEGTYIADYPFYHVTQADSTESTAKATEVLDAWLAREIDVQLAGKFGFRSADGATRTVVDFAHGAIETLPSEDQVHPMPSGEVARWLIDEWLDDCTLKGLSCSLE